MVKSSWRMLAEKKTSTKHLFNAYCPSDTWMRYALYQESYLAAYQNIRTMFWSCCGVLGAKLTWRWQYIVSKSVLWVARVRVWYSFCVEVKFRCDGGTGGNVRGSSETFWLLGPSFKLVALHRSRVGLHSCIVAYTWMYKTFIQGHCSGVPPILPGGHLQYCSTKFHMRPINHFPHRSPL